MKAVRILFLLALVLMVVSPVTISLAQDPTTISVWYHSGQGGERDNIQAQVDAFNASQSDYQVELALLPEGSYPDQVKAATLAEDLPCLLDFDGPYVYNYAWSGDLLPLDSYVSDDLRTDFLPSIIEQGTYNGHLYTLGSIDSGLAIWGNKALLEQAGVRIPTGVEDAWTLDEFNAAMEAIAAIVPTDGYVIDFKIPYGGEWWSYGFAPIIQGFGGDLINREDYSTAEGFLNGPEAVAAMTWFQGLFTQGYANANPVDHNADFTEGRVALSWVGHWMYPSYKEALGDNLVLIPMPILGEKAVTGNGSWNWSITSSCENPDGAWAFLDFIFRPENIQSTAEATGAIPARISVLAEDERYQTGGDLYVYYQQLTSGIALPRPQTPAYPTISEAMATAINDIALGADVQTALDTAVDTIDTDIEANNGYPVAE
jgi:multiple sugar transport system substrate-binding protein